MGLFSGLNRVKIDMLKPLRKDKEQIVFLLSTIDGFKTRQFHCILFYTVSITDASGIKDTIENIKSHFFYTEIEKVKKGDFVEIDTESGKVAVAEFTETEYEIYGKPKNWKNL
jgi:hypothetical protein